jgi:hypothetical protein
MRKSGNFLLMLSLLFTIWSCGGRDSEAVDPSGNNYQPETMQEPAEPIAVERKLIKTGSVSFETPDLAETQQKVRGAITKYGGYISSDSEYKSYDRITNTIEIRVPNKDFDNLLNDIVSGIERLDDKTISVQDVTEEYLDAAARIKTKKELELRYHELLKEAKTVTEMLEIEKQIGDLRTEIESIEGRLKFLQDQVTLSTLTVTFYQRIPEDKKWDGQFAKSVKSGWHNLIYFFLALIHIWPFIVIGIIVLIIVRRSMRKKKAGQ